MRHDLYLVVFAAFSLGCVLAMGGPATAADVNCGAGGDGAGVSVATGADFDGDGIDDVAFGAPCARVDGEPAVGRAYVYSGATGSRLLAVKGTMRGQKLGGAIDFIDDVSGDGLADVIVGSQAWSVSKPGSGFKDNAGKIEIFSRTGTLWLTIEGEYGGGNFGEALAGLSDVDGDQVSDLAVGAGNDRAMPAGDRFGAVYLFSGLDGHLIDLSHGDRKSDQWGAVVSRAGDIDGDEIEDVVVASSLADFDDDGTIVENTGLIRVLSGADFSLVLAEARGGEEHKLGRSTAIVGDIDGDGKTDLAGGAPGAPVGNLGNAGVVVVHSIETMQPVRVFAEPVPQIGAGFGLAIAGLGFVDGDDIADFAGSSPAARSNNMAEGGRVHVYSGADGSVLWTRSGTVPGARTGHSLAGGPDWDQDGSGDVVIGAPGDAVRGRRGAGSVTVVSGDDGSEIFSFGGRRGIETRVFALGWRLGGTPHVRSFNHRGRRKELRQDVYRGLRAGALSVAVLDDASTNEPEDIRLVLGTGSEGSAPRVQVVRAARRGGVLSDFQATFSADYQGGVTVAAGEVASDTGEEIVVAQADSADGHVEVSLYKRFDTDPLGRIVWVQIGNFSVFQPTTAIQTVPVNAGGTNVAVGQAVAGDLDEIVVAPTSGAPVVRVFSAVGELISEWLAFPAGQGSGASVAVGNLDGTGAAEIVMALADGQPRVRAFHSTGEAFINPATGQPVDFFVALSEPGFVGGLRVAVADVDLDGNGEILVVPGEGIPTRIHAYELSGQPVTGWRRPFAFGPGVESSAALAATDRFIRHP